MHIIHRDGESTREHKVVVEEEEEKAHEKNERTRSNGMHQLVKLCTIYNYRTRRVNKQ